MCVNVCFVNLDVHTDCIDRLSCKLSEYPTFMDHLLLVVMFISVPARLGHIASKISFVILISKNMWNMFHVFSTSRYISWFVPCFCCCSLGLLPHQGAMSALHRAGEWQKCIASWDCTGTEPTLNRVLLVISPCLSCLVGIVVVYSRCRCYSQNPWLLFVLVWNDEAWRGYFVGILWPDVIGKINFGEFADAISRASTIAPANHVENCDQEIFYGFPLWRLVEIVWLGSCPALLESIKTSPGRC